MKIRKIVLSNFKNFSGEIRLDKLSPHGNVFIGKNGAGKSSIISAIIFVIDAHTRIGPAERRNLVNENSAEMKLFVEIEFDNRNKAFPAGDHFTVRRTVTQKTEEYTLDNRVVSREEMASLYETAGLTKVTPYFFVAQGRIGELAQMNGTSKMSMIRELAGSTVYEKDKEESIRALEEATALEAKIKELMETLQQRTTSIEETNRLRDRKTELITKKDILIKELYKRELNKVRAKLEEFITEESTHMDTIANKTEEDLRHQLQSILAQIPPSSEATAQSTDPDIENRQENRLIEQYISEKPNSMTDISIPEIEKQILLVNAQLDKLSQAITASAHHISELEQLQSAESAIRSQISALRMKLPKEIEQEIVRLRSILTTETQAEYSKKKEELIEERRVLWRKEKDNNKQKEKALAQMKQCERAFLISTKGFMLNEELKTIPGVIGYVYDLITMPPEILLSVVATVPHILSTIVVQTREDAMHLVRAHRIEQSIIPLSITKSSTQNKAAHPIGIPALSQYVSCALEHAPLIEHLFGSIYFANDFDTAKEYSFSHKVNVITPNKEYFSKTGSITGGQENESSKFKKYLQAKEEYKQAKEEETRISQEKYRNEQEYLQILQHDSEQKRDLTKETLFFLENPDIDIEDCLITARAEQDQLIYQRSASSNQLNHLQKELALQKEHQTTAHLRHKAKQIEKQLATLALPEDWKDSQQEKTRLEAKFRKIQRKILLLNVESVESIELDSLSTINLKEASKEQLVKGLFLIKKYIQEMPPVIQDANVQAASYTEISQKVSELSRAKKRIADMQQALEIKKEEVISITVRQVKENFEYFFEKLTQGKAKATIVPGTQTIEPALEIQVSFNQEPMVKSDELSGGQKAMVALCIILSLQRIYEAPFYLLDEFDANLDTYFLSSIVNSRIFSEKQLFICTFRGETLGLGEKFMQVKDQSVHECTLAEAQSLICSYIK
ncbi:structural maintenance of chromosome 3 (chondroitin sulfate proteoglycan 6) [Nematocida sp. AWRm80]|nr:structural maintenance of chromosome 3 (chondroitin sulfate proteoglycan 6) [Nematocida sp. AWRm80]